MRALVLSGGGSHAAFQAGVIRGLAALGVRWDIVVGSSAGALNAAYLTQSPRREQGRRADELLAFWRRLKAPLVYKTNTFGLIRDALGFPGAYRPSLLDTAPLRRLIDAEVTGPALVHLMVTATSLTTGETFVADAARCDIRPWVLASAAVPVIFPPVEIDGQLWIDGGVRRNTPLEEALRAGATEIDVALCAPISPSPLAADARPGVLEIAERTLTAALSSADVGDVDEWSRSSGARVRVYAPKEPAKISILSFDPPAIARLLQQGQSAVDESVALT